MSADARAPSTRRVYRSDVDRYVLWATDRGIAPFPTSPEIVMRHVIFLVDDKKKISSIDRALVALALAQRMAGGTDFRTDSTFREFIKGLRRSLRDSRKSARRRCFRTPCGSS